jgi:tyrosyl-tRNA synthetase
MDLHIDNQKKLTPEEQVIILMRGTRFADESDEFSSTTDKLGSLRIQMQNELLNKLKKGRPLKVYYGVDPTGNSLHIGHFVPIQKLRKFQELGHHIIFMVGDYTATIGDPSGQAGERKRFTHEQVKTFAKKYTEFAFKLLDPEKTEVRYNSEWLDKLSFADIIELACIFPLKQIIARRDFQKRMDNGESLRFHEALYSLMQGFDAYNLKCDVQVAGYDQHFNLLAGRNIQQHFGDEPHVMITGPLIPGTDGRKMSKSYNNSINLDDKPFDMYGKTMRIQDELIPIFLELTSSLELKVIKNLIDKLKNSSNPMVIKKCLAFNLVEQYHSAEDAKSAELEFYKVVQMKSDPDSIKEVEVPDELIGFTWIVLCSELKLVKSKGEIRRLIGQGGFYVENQQMKDIEQVVNIVDEGITIRLGKRKYFKLKRK